MAGSLQRSVRALLTPAARTIRKEVLPRIFPAPRHRFPDPLRQVRVVGLLSSASGLGRSARLCAGVLGEAGYGVCGADVAALYRSDDGLASGLPAAGEDAVDASIYHLNPPMLLPGILRANPLKFWRGYNIAYWAWELEVLPREWIRAIDLVDAILVPSTFCKRAVERHTAKPVIVVPHPVTLDAPAAGRDPAAQDAAPFRVVSVFNFGSSFERKNPIAAIEAFRRAFGADGDAELVLKVGDGDRYPLDRKTLLAAIGGSRNIRLVDVIWDETRLAALIGSADAYLSLHRSEGFGLTLAEAIAAGVPVIATDWSGNLDFCPPGLGFPVAFALVPVRDAHLSFQGLAGAVWAEPSIESAAEHLRDVRSDPARARAKAATLKDHLRSYLGATTYLTALAQLEAGAAPRDALVNRRADGAWAGR